MEEYFYIYKDSTNKWCEATNPTFIARHSKCRAIKKADLLDKFNNVLQFINKANDYFGDERASNFILETDLNEIV